MVKFLRRTWSRYSKLGKRRKKKQKWRRPSGRDNKMREKRKGYPAVVSIGYKGGDERGKIEGKMPVIVRNIKELGEVKEGRIAIIGRVGREKKIEILKKAREKKIPVYNLNIDKFLKEVKNREEGK